MFHITEDGPKPCSAEQGKCPYARAGQKHFSNEADAVKFYETEMSKSYGMLSNLKGKKAESDSPKKKDHLPAAKILQQFSQTSALPKGAFTATHKDRLSLASQKDRQRTLQLKKVLTSK